MEGSGFLDQFEFFGSRPEIGFIKTKDVVSNQDIRVSLNHPIKPCDNHQFLRRIGMNLDARNVGAVRKHKQMSLGSIYCSARQRRSNLNNRVTCQGNDTIQRFSQEFFHCLLAVARHFQHSIKRIRRFREFHVYPFSSHSFLIGRVDRRHTLCK